MKRNVFIKVVSLVLCLLTLVVLFAACGEKKGGGVTTTTTTTPTTTTTTGTEDPRGQIKDPKGGGIIPPEVDYGGWEAELLIWNPGKTQLFPEKMVDGESIQNDLYERNDMLEEVLGMTFITTFKASHMSGGSDADELYQEALTSRTAYDAICCYTLYASKLALEGKCVDLNTLDYPYAAMPWYPADIYEWEILDRLFFITNNSSIRNIIANWCIYANNVMIGNKGLENIEDVVIAGDWTLAKLKEYSRNWEAEAQSNANKEEADRVYGFAIVHRTSIQAFWYAAGFKACRINSDGNPEFAFYEKTDVQLISNFVDEFLDICDSPEFGYGPNGAFSGNWDAPLRNKNAAFYAGALDGYTMIGEDGTFSVIPLPKLTADQEKYYGVQNYAYDVWCVPDYSLDPSVGGCIIEATSYDDYTNIANKFFDSDFKYRYSSSEKGVKIFELIREATVADFSRIWGMGSPANALNNCISTGADKFLLQNTFATQVGGDRVSANKALENLMKMVGRLDESKDEES